MSKTPGLPLPFGIDPVNPVPVDSNYGPYISLASAKSSVPLALRYDGLTVQVTGLGNYWWEASDLSDTGLKIKGTNGTITSVFGTTNQIVASTVSGATTLSLPSDVHISGNMFIGGTSSLQWGDTGIGGAITGFVSTVSDGVFRFGDSGGGGSPRIVLGSVSSTLGIAIQRNGTSLEIKVGDNSAYGNFTSLSSTFNSTSNQIVLGTTKLTTISATMPVTSFTATLPDWGGNDSFVGVNATQLLSNKRFNGSTYFGSNTTPTTFVDIQGSVAGTGSLRIRSGVSNGSITTPLDGTFNNDGTNLYAYVNGSWKQLDNVAYTFNNGLTNASGTVSLGGTMLNDTVISGAKSMFFNGVTAFKVDSDNILLESTLNTISLLINATSITQNIAGNFSWTMDSTSSRALFTDNRTVKIGIEYAADYSSSYNARSLIDYGSLSNGSIGKLASSSLYLPTTASQLIGTINVNNNRFIHSFGTDNLFIGTNSGNYTLTVASAVQNVGIGTGVLSALTTGSLNVGVGYQTLFLNDVGLVNTAVGYQSLYTNTGSSNTAFGYSAMFFNTIGGNNVAAGETAMYSNTSGIGNVAVGKAAMAASNQTGIENTAVGYRAMQSGGLSSNWNTAIGTHALFLQNAGDKNTAIGGYSLYTNTTGFNNTAIGYDALARNTTGIAGVAIGYYAGEYNTTENGRFYLNNQDRGDITGDITKSLMYGIFDALPANQSMQINGKTILSQGLQIVGTPTVGYVWTATDTVGNGSWQLNSGASYTFTSGLTNTSGTVTNNLITGISGGQTVIGGTGVTDGLSYKPTTANATLTVAAHRFLGGNNGTTTIGTLYNNGNWNIGNATTTNQRLVRIGQDTAFIDIGSYTSTTSTAAIYMNASTPGASNYTIAVDASGGTVLRAQTGDINVVARGNASMSLQASANIFQNYQNWFQPNLVSGGTALPFYVQTPSNILQTASTNTPGVKFDSGTRQYSTGNITTQQEFLVTAPVYSFVAASTITDAYTFYTSAPTAGTNATITNRYAAGFNGNVSVTGNIKIVDGNQAASKVFTSDANGLGSWQSLPVASLTSTQVAFGDLSNAISSSANFTYATSTLTVERADAGSVLVATNDAHHMSGEPAMLITDGGGGSLGLGYTNSHMYIRGITANGIIIQGGGAYGLLNSTNFTNNGMGFFGGSVLPTANVDCLGSTASIPAMRIRPGITNASISTPLDGFINYDGSNIWLWNDPTSTWLQLDNSLPTSLFLPTTTSLTVGTIQMNSNRFIHAYGTNNFFAGLGSGNYTLTSQDNTGVGTNTLSSITTATGNTAIGHNCLANTTIGIYNVGIGYESLKFNTGDENIGIGWHSLYNATGGFNVGISSGTLFTNTTGAYNIAIGYHSLNANNADANVAVGYGTLDHNTTGIGNCAIGFQGLTANITGSYSVTLGYNGLANHTTSTNNIAIGINVMFGMLTGNDNTAVGGYAMEGATGGSGLNAFGARSLHSNTTGTDNSAFGNNALYSNTTGTNNVGMGTAALNANISGFSNVGIGFNALLGNTIGHDNIGIGELSLGTNNGGNLNIAIGTRTLYANKTTGDRNVAIGYLAMASNTTGESNFAGGYEALFNNSTGYYNTAIGSVSLFTNTTGFQNFAVGRQALYSNNGNDNIALGHFSLINSTSTNNSVAIGSYSGQSNTTGVGNIFIGFRAGSYSTTDSNSFYLDNQDRTNTAGDKSKALLYGIFNASAASQSLTVNGKAILSQGLQIVATTTTGYVWTATDTVGNGSWQAANTGTSGTATLSGGTLTVSSSAVTASCKIFVTGKGDGGNLGSLYEIKASRINATSFVISSSNVLDTQTFDWLVIQ